jgi:hypothetical protein
MYPIWQSQYSLLSGRSAHNATFNFAVAVVSGLQPRDHNLAAIVFVCNMRSSADSENFQVGTV